jgi:hypothetical protein
LAAKNEEHGGDLPEHQGKHELPKGNESISDQADTDDHCGRPYRDRYSASKTAVPPTARGLGLSNKNGQSQEY